MLIVLIILLSGFGLSFILAVIFRLFNKSKTTKEWFWVFVAKGGDLLFYPFFYGLQLAVLIFVVLIMWMVVFYVLEWGESHLDSLGYSLLIIICFIYFLFWLNLTGKKNFYSFFTRQKIRKDVVPADMDQTEYELFRKKQSEDDQPLPPFWRSGMSFLVPLVIIIGLSMLGISCFAALTAVLNNAGKISFSPELTNESFSPLNDFYLWHFCDLIPQIKVPDTFHWNLTFQYTSSGVALLLIVFKSLMAYIVIARFYTWNKWRQKSITGSRPSL